MHADQLLISIPFFVAALLLFPQLAKFPARPGGCEWCGRQPKPGEPGCPDCRKPYTAIRWSFPVAFLVIALFDAGLFALSISADGERRLFGALYRVAETAGLIVWWPFSFATSLGAPDSVERVGRVPAGIVAVLTMYSFPALVTAAPLAVMIRRLRRAYPTRRPAAFGAICFVAVASFALGYLAFLPSAWIFGR